MADVEYSISTTLLLRAVASKIVQELCDAVSLRVRIHHNPRSGRTTLSLARHNWQSPQFGAVSELEAFAAEMRRGLLAYRRAL
jgi:hypothetical protein